MIFVFKSVGRVGRASMRLRLKGVQASTMNIVLSGIVFPRQGQKKP